jgi:membrane-bound metal-dependent hydrolase YbcI (DUF457 family)
MTFPTHFFAGLAIGAATGDYSVALVTSVAPDLDHAISFARHGVFRSPSIFWKTITAETDPWSDQRNILHNVIVVAVLIAFVGYFFPAHVFTFGLSYGVHLLLDALDASDYFPLYPWKGINLRGPVHYNSKWEYVITAAFIAFFVLVYLECFSL